MNSNNKIEGEKPLSPEAERVSRKVSRYGALIMGFNLFALLFLIGVIVYKLFGIGDSEDQSNTISTEVELEQVLDLPDGAEIVSASQNGSQILLNLKMADGKSAIWIYDYSDKKIVGKIKID